MYFKWKQLGRVPNKGVTMPTASFEMTIEVTAEYHETNPGYEGDRGEPESGAEIQIDSMNISGLDHFVYLDGTKNYGSIFPEFNQDQIAEWFHQTATNHIYENYEDLSEQNAPDPDWDNDDGDE